MSATRVSFLIRETSSGERGPVEVRGAEISLPLFGKGKTALVKDQDKKTVLRFLGRYLTSARQEEPPDFEEFASLELGARLTGTPPRVLAAFSPTAKIHYENPIAEKDEARMRVLKLEYSRSFFKNAPAPNSELCELRLPLEKVEKDQAEAAHFELGISLEIDGAEESSFELNDVLDVPLRPLMVGLVIEWPTDLDERVPPGLTLKAVQGERIRHVRWLDGLVRDGVRQFVFRGVLGADPVDLFALVNRTEHQLWDQVDITDEEGTPTWVKTLETVCEPAPGAEPENLSLQTSAVQKTDRLAGPPANTDALSGERA